YARELSRAAEGLVRQVVCLGSPVDRRRGDGSRITPLYKIINRKYLEADNEAMVHQMASEPPVPTSMIYSREDGIVHWTTCQQDDPSHQAENIRVFGSHSGMGFNPAIYYVIADRLSQAEGEWQRFSPPLWLRAMVPDHKH
ncbi:MAG: alpha/beta hydrolase, partial [Congregibacter sp.]|nr:alpha/beta hydrolase [Congregibacter sp.]